MSKDKDIDNVLKLLKKFLKDGRSFCFQAQSQCDYFNISLSSKPGAVREKTQYYHSTELDVLVEKIKLMIEMSKDEKIKTIVDEDILEDFEDLL